MACLYSVMLPWQRNTRQLKYQNTEVYLFILCYANFGDPGINGFGKIENATQVSKTVFSHLNAEELTVSLFRPVFFERKKVVVINCLQGNINRDVALIIYYLKIFYPETGVRKQYLESITA